MNITQLKKYYITEIILLSTLYIWYGSITDFGKWTVFALQADFMIVSHHMPPGFLALQIYDLFYTLKMIDWTDHQFINLFTKF